MSMTGFGGAQRSADGIDGRQRIEVEIRAVNGRFLEVRLKQPFGPKTEQALRKLADGRLGRGRIEAAVHVRTETAEAEETSPLSRVGVEPQRLSDAVAAAAAAGEEAARAKLSLSAPSAFELLRFAGSIRQPNTAASPTAPAFLAELFAEALDELCAFRAREGAALETVLSGLANDLETEVGRIANLEPEERERLTTKLADRARELGALVGAAAPDPERVAAEVALLVAKGDVTEELDRIASHLTQLRGTLAQDASSGQGKTLDFLTQELFREVNTIGSKITSHAGSRSVIACKAIIERIREQVQNVE